MSTAITTPGTWEPAYWRAEIEYYRGRVEGLQGKNSPESEEELKEVEGFLLFCMSSLEQVEAEELERPSWGLMDWLTALDRAEAKMRWLFLSPEAKALDAQTWKWLEGEAKREIAFYRQGVVV